MALRKVKCDTICQIHCEVKGDVRHEKSTDDFIGLEGSQEAGVVFLLECLCDVLD